MKRTVLLVVIIAMSVAMIPFARRVGGQSQTSSPKYVSGEILIQFRAGASDADKQAARNLAGASRKRLIRADAGAGELESARIPGNVTVENAISFLQRHPAVRFAEPNWIYTHQETSNDPYYTNGSLWGMYGDTTSPANQYGSQAAEAWAAGHTGSDTVYVGVIDEGIDLNHPDLAANIWTNPFDPPDGVDNDGNGFVDDIHGWDFNSNDNSIYDGTVDDHGTHVSGTIGAVGGNGVGVAGVNWQVTIISAKFLGSSGGTTENAIRAVDYITDLKTRHGLNIVATNNSWGGGGYSQGLQDAIIRMAKADILFCAAAGNGNLIGVGQNNDTRANYPSNYNTTQGTSTETAASYDGVIAVASITSSGARSSFSNYGKTTVDLGAPGSGIYSTTPGNTYSSFSGTSMATPHVTGATALYKSVNPGATASDIKNAILNSAINTPTSSLNNITVTNGRLNIGYLLGGPPPPPDPPAAPSALSATAASSSQINLAWTDNANNEDGFKIERCQGAGCESNPANFAQIATVGANVTSYQNTGLSASTSYSYRVRANNTAGDSDYSNTASATTQSAGSAPADPSNLRTTAVVARRIDLAWNDNANNETKFELERCTGSTCTNFAKIAEPAANATTYTNTGLTRATTYRYRIRACNGSGCSGYSNILNATTN
ncbi:MAG: S8 family serine peptidase [Blastocatellia bacterium]